MKTFENSLISTRKYSIYVASCYYNGIARTDCRCDQRFLVSEWDLFVNQKLRKVRLGRVDIKATAARKRTVQRKEEEEKTRKILEH